MITGFELPASFTPNQVEVLVKLLPGFLDAAPDMFWVSLPVKTPNGAEPRATCNERLLGRNWQRFSSHLAKPAPGSRARISGLPSVHSCSFLAVGLRAS